MFFGVITKVWGRTIPARRIFESAIILNSNDDWQRICKWVYDTNDRTPKHGVETVLATCYLNKNIPGLDDDISDRNLMTVVDIMAYADSMEEAMMMLREYEKLPEDLKDLLIVRTPLTEKTWGQLFDEQDMLNPSGNGERWQCDSILNGHKVPREKVCTKHISFLNRLRLS
jgi:hypothetical protein